MALQDDIKAAKRISIGLLAHVDAGKTTLSEDILFHTGVIRRTGRVDHRDTFFDTDSRERKRGITIFSKEAEFSLGDKCFYLMDTPGHTDFSAEMERVLSVLDYAVLIISGPNGVQSHTRTLWRLLKRYELPAFIFINKIDMEGTDREAIMKELRSELSESCVELPNGSIDDYSEELLESIAMSSESLMEEYLEAGSLSMGSMIKAIRGRELYPCIFGSALKDEGVTELLSVLSAFAEERSYKDTFSARVFKITRDQKGNRLTHMKLTGGSIRLKESIAIPVERAPGAEASGVKAELSLEPEGSADSSGALSGAGAKDRDLGTVSEKIEGIRQYSGERYTELSEATAGMVVAVTGLTATQAGMGLGAEEGEEKPLLVPLFEYALIPPFDVDRKQLYLKLKPLEDEIPELLLSYVPARDEIHIRLMGDVQNEVLTDLIEERFKVKVEFGEASVIYKETIAGSVEGVGHFEPLRHYAEVHLLLEPGEPGSGIEAVDMMGEGKGLSGNYRRLILSHILEKEHLGVLTGSGLTDVRISLVAGRSHDKHTEGGDFREATYRAIRQGLMYAENVLLEPYYEFKIKLPSEFVGRAMTDIQRMSGSFELDTVSDRESLLWGRAPVSLIKNYNAELISYTKGLGSLSLSFCGYGRCHDGEAVVERMAYDPEADMENAPGSVFCAHGAGFYVPWNEVYDMMHLPFATDAMNRLGAAGRGASGDLASSDGAYIEEISGQFPMEGTEAGELSGSASDGTEAKLAFSKGRGSASSGSRKSSGKDYGYLDQGYENDKELMGIFRRTFGLTKSERYADREDDEVLLRSRGSGQKKKWTKSGNDRRAAAKDPREATAPDFVSIEDRKKSYLLVDGYNIIFAWEELKELSKINLDSARVLLMDILSNYQGYKGMNLILVFDAYRVKGGQRKIERYHNIYVVYTEEAETADKYIEKTVHDMDKKHDVTVATSDGLEQIIVFGEGAARLSARELYEEVMAASSDMREHFLERRTKLWNTVIKDTENESK